MADDHHQSQIAASLRLSEAKLAGILASAMDAIITVDEDQSIVLFNAAAEKMFRCPAAEVLGESLDRFIPERFRAAHREHIRVFGETNVTQQMRLTDESSQRLLNILHTNAVRGGEMIKQVLSGLLHRRSVGEHRGDDALVRANLK